MLRHRKVAPSIKSAGGTHLYTCVERGTVRAKCFAQEYNTLCQAKARTQTVQSGGERSNLWWVITVIIQFLIFGRVITFCIVMNFLYVWILCWFYQFSDRIQKFSSDQIFRQPKLSVDLNFRVVSGFGDLFEFPTSFEHFTSPIRFWWIFCQ